MTTSAILSSWALAPWWIALLTAGALVYWRGWRGLHRRRPRRFSGWRLASFLGGLAVLFVAVASPLDAFANFLLQVHMVQHLLLMLVAAPLLLLGWPALPMLRGLPATVRRHWVGPFLAAPEVRRLWRLITHPVVCWLSFVVCLWVWHVPVLYELALRSPGWHRAEHALFLASAILFWWPVVEPYPFAPQWPRWTVIPYLLLASIQNTVLAAIFAFADHVFYSVYEQAPRLVDMTALQDQAAAGAIMWVPGSIIMLIPVASITRTLMMSPALRAPPAARAAARPAPPRGEAAFDLLRVRGVGALLRSRRVRISLRGVMLLAAGLIVVDGLLGPQIAPMNLAGVLPWTHWRGLVVIALLIAGNVSCMVCPFMLPRTVGRRIFSADRPWPRPLRSKWLAVGLVAGYLGAYEVFDLWASPWWTAWIIVGYFAAALAVDGIFRGASFCKYVCPIGQYQFVHSLVSPLQVRVRDAGVCAACRTHECIRGSARAPGCETDLFQPRKAGNLDCTFCLDCVSACPHDNVGVIAAVPGADLIDDRRRSSLGRLSRRPDVAALAVVFAFGAFANAAGMVGPVLAAQARCAQALGISPLLVTAATLVASVVLAPALVVAAAAVVSRRFGGVAGPLRRIACRFALTLVPLGFAMWFAHMVFHLVTGAGSFVPVVQRFLDDHGLPWLGAPDWTAGMSSPSWLVPLEITALGLGLVVSVALAWLVAVQEVAPPARALRAAAPWALVASGLYAFGVWTMFQPMQMRGTMMMTGTG
jgi:cytochrome c oxidase assembly factor CtaG/ferredoxin